MPINAIRRRGTNFQRGMNMRNTKAPSSDAAYAEWLAKLAELASQRATDLPLSSLQIANLDALSRLFASVLSDSERSKAQWKQDVADKNHLRKEAEAYCQMYCEQILADPTVPDHVKVELGLFRATAKKCTLPRRLSTRIQSSHAYA